MPVGSVIYYVDDTGVLMKYYEGSRLNQLRKQVPAKHSYLEEFNEFITEPILESVFTEPGRYAQVCDEFLKNCRTLLTYMDDFLRNTDKPNTLYDHSIKEMRLLHRRYIRLGGCEPDYELALTLKNGDVMTVNLKAEDLNNNEVIILKNGYYFRKYEGPYNDKPESFESLLSFYGWPVPWAKALKLNQDDLLMFLED
jgi:hypothetical protein